MHFIKTEKLCSSKDTVKKIIRQLANYEKIFANHISIKGLHSQSWMISKQANSKIGKISKEKIHQEEYTDDKAEDEKSYSSTHRIMHFRLPMKCYYKTIRMFVIKLFTIPSVVCTWSTVMCFS